MSVTFAPGRWNSYSPGASLAAQRTPGSAGRSSAARAAVGPRAATARAAATANARRGRSGKDAAGRAEGACMAVLLWGLVAERTGRCRPPLNAACAGRAERALKTGRQDLKKD